MAEKENGKTENDSGVFAVCLKCGNRWKVRKLDVKKRKCPVCGSYRTALESEAYSQNSMVEEEEKTENRDGTGESGNAKGFDSAVPAYSDHSTGENNGYSAEKLENSVEKEKNRTEKPEEKKRKKQRRKIDEEIIEFDDEAIDELIEDEDGKAKKEKKKEKRSRSWILWIAAVVFIFGLLYWFLSSLGKKRSREVPERQPEEPEPDFGGAIPGLV